MERQITQKINFVLYTILFVFALLTLRLWYLTFLKQDEALKEAQKPKSRTIVIHANRGTIVDRFGIPLAQNRLRYDAAIYYSHIRQIPTAAWKKDETHQKVKSFPRKEYIAALSQKIASELHLDAERIEDLIHSKAALLPHVPFILKEGLSEKEYFRLKMLEKDWLGLSAEIRDERFYPQGKTAGSIVGYLGSISERHYFRIANEIQLLQQFLDNEDDENALALAGLQNRKEVLSRLNELKEKAYRFDDLVGKDGLEGQFEEGLRGFCGKKSFEVDINGKFLKELPNSRPPISGTKIESTISLEMQRLAEELLCQDEEAREGRSFIYDPVLKESLPQKQPWIKRGAIVALDPRNGEVWALASFPRFDPGDFVAQNASKINRSLETPQYIASIWDGKDNFMRERFDMRHKSIREERKELSLEFFLDLILPKDSPLRSILLKLSVKKAIELQENVEALLYFSKQKDVQALFEVLFPLKDNMSSLGPIEKALAEAGDEVVSLKRNVKNVLASIPDNGDKLFLVDLCRVLVYSPAFTDELIGMMESFSLSEYWRARQAFYRFESIVKPLVKNIFHKVHFKNWRAENQKEFLKKKREAEGKTFARPYIDYLDKKEKELFADFWQEKGISLLAALIEGKGKYEESLLLLRQQELIKQKLKNLYKKDDFAFLKTIFSQYHEEFLDTLLHTFRSLTQMNRPLFSSFKERSHIILEKDLAAAFYPRFGFGYTKPAAFRDASPMGSIFKIVTAYSVLKERYQKLEEVASLNPLTIIDKIEGHNVAFTEDGKPYSRYYKGGRLPISSHSNIGKVDLIGALEQSSNPYFSLVAGECLSHPNALLNAAKDFNLGQKSGLQLPGEVRGTLPSDLEDNKTGLYSFAIGQHTFLATPIQAAVLFSALVNGGQIIEPQIVKRENLPVVKKNIDLPKAVQKTILEGLARVVSGDKGSARYDVIRKLKKDKALLEQYRSLENDIVGKTGTAEVVYNFDLTPSSKGQKYKHLWFASCLFSPDSKPKWSEPELVVVVYLMFGDGGKEAAPLAAKIINKYLEITAHLSK